MNFPKELGHALEELFVKAKEISASTIHASSTII